MHRQIVALCGSAVALMFAAGVAFAQDQEFKLVIQDHKFSPAELTVPADKKIKLVIENKDATPEEFESKELKREKVIPGKSSGTVTVGPLKPGRYPFFGEFNPKTAQGVLIVQ
jgi:hypothetical protein